MLPSYVDQASHVALNSGTKGVPLTNSGNTDKSLKTVFSSITVFKAQNVRFDDHKFLVTIYTLTVCSYRVHSYFGQL